MLLSLYIGLFSGPKMRPDVKNMLWNKNQLMVKLALSTMSSLIFNKEDNNRQQKDGLRMKMHVRQTVAHATTDCIF